MRKKQAEESADTTFHIDNKQFMDQSKNLRRQRTIRALLVFFFSSIIISALIVIYLSYQIPVYTKRIQNELITIADLKTNQIADWYGERLNDARQIHQTTVLQSLAIKYLQNPNDTNTGIELKKWMQMKQELDSYASIHLFDAEGNSLLSIPPLPRPLTLSHDLYIEACIDSAKIMFYDLHRDIDKTGQVSKEVHLSHWIPVSDNINLKSKPMGIWVLRIDPQHFLYPMIQSWPVQSKTAETLLVRREGNSILYLNDLRYQKDTAARLKLDIGKNPRLPAAMAASGITGVVDGVSYRGQKVMAVIRKVPGTPWYMVAQIDKQEIYQPLRRMTAIVSFVLLLLLVSVAMEIGLVERKKDNESLRKQLHLELEKIRLQEENITIQEKTEQALRMSERRFRNVFENSLIGISLTSPEGIVDANPAMCRMLGFTHEELLRNFTEITHPDDVAQTREYAASMLKGEANHYRFTKRYIHKSGSVVWTDISTFLQRKEDNTPEFFISMIQDITQQKDTETAWKESEERFRLMVERSPFGIYMFQGDEQKAEYLNPTFIRFFGYNIDEVGYVRDWWLLAYPDEEYRRQVRSEWMHKMEIAVKNHTSMEPMESIVTCKDGSKKYMSWGFISTEKLNWAFCVDMTEWKKAENELVRINRVYAVISQVNQMVVRTRNKDLLYRGMCDIAVDYGKFRMAWIGEIDEEQQIVKPFCWAGHEDGYLSTIKTISILDIPAGRGPTGTAARTGKYCCSADVQSENIMEIWKNEALSRSYQSSIALPIIVHDRVRAVLSIYSSETDFFKESEIRLLDEVTGDIAFALEMLEIEQTRQQAIGALKDSEYRFRELFENMSSGVTIYSADESGSDFIIKAINNAGEVITRRNRSEIIGKRVLEVFPGVKEMGLYDVLVNVNKSGDPQEHATSYYHDNKLTSWFENYVMKLENGDIVAIYDDVSLRMRAEAEVLEKEQRLQAIIDNAPFGAHTYELRADDRLVLIGANLSSDAILHIDTKALLGLDLLEAFPGNKDTGLDELYRNVARGAENYTAEQVAYNDGKIAGAFEIHAMNIGKNRMTVFFKDITEKKRAEDAIKHLNEDLEQRVLERTTQLELANKEMEAFSYSVSHDLRAPLRSIDGWSHILKEDYEPHLDEQGKQYIQRIRLETQRLGELIDALLELSHTSRAKVSISKVELSNLAHKVAERLREAEPMRQVNFMVEPGLCDMGDSRLLEAVLTNLIGNAWKFTSTRPEAVIEFGKVKHHEIDTYYIKDNGVGFNMNTAQKLFGAFQRMHKTMEFPGTGVGLATVQRIINSHGGKIWAEAEVDKGATFYFTLKDG